MFLPTAICALVFSLPGAGSLASMFDTTSKDFGNVPYGSVNTHRFVLKNTLATAVHLSGVRTSCKCAQPTAITSFAQPGEEIIIEVKYDARLFVGARSMTIYASFDQPYYETVGLRVSGVSRQDVVVEPGEVDLGTLTKDSEARREIRVEFAGNSDWAIQNISAGDGIQATVQTENRQPGRVEYLVAVSIDPNAPAGPVNSYVQITTNDQNVHTLLVPVTAQIQPNLVVSPESVQLGTVQQGEKQTRRLVIRGTQPFAIESVSGAPVNIQVSATGGERTVHLVQVDFEAGAPGDVDLTLNLNTNLEKEKVIQVKVAGTVLQR